MHNTRQYHFRIRIAGLSGCFDYEYVHSELKVMAVHVYHFLFNDVLWHERAQILKDQKLPCHLNTLAYYCDEAVRQFRFEAEVFSSDGKSFNVFDLYRWGSNQRDTRNRYWRHSWCDTWNGEGAVPGTSKRRGGRHYYRRMATQPERRMNQVFAEEGEPAVRSARHPFNLPNARDDFQLHRERNWKSQHKGCKAWDK